MCVWCVCLVCVCVGADVCVYVCTCVVCMFDMCMYWGRCVCVCGVYLYVWFVCIFVLECFPDFLASFVPAQSTHNFTIFSNSAHSFLWNWWQWPSLQCPSLWTTMRERPSFAECISDEMKVGVLAELQQSDCEEKMQWAELPACTFTFPRFTVLPLEWELGDFRALWLGCFFIWLGNGCENMHCLDTTVIWGLVYFTANRTLVSSLVCSVCHPGPVLSVVLASSGSPHNCHLSCSLTYHCSYIGCSRLCIFFVKVKGNPKEHGKAWWDLHVLAVRGDIKCSCLFLVIFKLPTCRNSHFFSEGVSAGGLHWSNGPVDISMGQFLYW